MVSVIMASRYGISLVFKLVWRILQLSHAPPSLRGADEAAELDIDDVV